MGFDVHGVSPTSAEGEHFRSNVWYWPGLWNYVADNCPAITDQDVRAGSFNDGHLIDEAKALAIADALDERLASGHVAAFADRHREAIENAREADCEACAGAGKTPCPDCAPGGTPAGGLARPEAAVAAVLFGTDAPLPGDHAPAILDDGANPPCRRCGGAGKTDCWNCGGKGRTRPWSTHYPFSAELVRRFAAFCRHSGGFEIW